MTMVRRYPTPARTGVRSTGDLRRSVTVLAAGLVLVSALTGCSGDEEKPAPPNGSATSAGPSAGAGPTASTGPAAELPVLVGRDAKVKDVPIRVDLNELTVEGRVTRLTFTARNLAPVVPGQSSNPWQIATFFNDGLDQKKAAAGPDDAFSVDGVYLVDRAGAKRYLAARNADQGCVCSGNLSNTFVGPSSAVVLTTVFAALPAGVDTVDVVVPGFGPFSAVPVSR
jgi:hypothetical protein